MRWKAHKQLQMQTLEPWKAKEIEERKMRRRAERAQHQEATAGDAGAIEEVSEEDQLQLNDERKSNETKKVEKFGEQYTFTIQDLSGEEFQVKFRTKTHMRVLMQSVYQRLMISPEDVAKVAFTFNNTEITSYNTAEELGMQDQDVIVLKGVLMEKQAQRKQAAKEREMAKAHLAAVADSAKNRERILSARKKVEKQRRLQNTKNDEAKRKHFRENNMVHLNLTDGHGKSVILGFKRNKWLGPLFKITCTRLGFFPEATHFKAEVNGTEVIIKSTDTINKLGLTEGAVITVNNNKRYSTVAPTE